MVTSHVYRCVPDPPPRARAPPPTPGRPPPDAAERVTPGPKQLSVWEPPFTRPPTAREVHGKHVVLRVGDDGPIILDSKRAVQMCETSHPPVWYFPKEDINMEYLTRLGGGTECEFKGTATFYNLSDAPQNGTVIVFSVDLNRALLCNNNPTKDATRIPSLPWVAGTIPAGTNPCLLRQHWSIP
jgi:uncharacterized protein (DUF427 family)